MSEAELLRQELAELLTRFGRWMAIIETAGWAGFALALAALALLLYRALRQRILEKERNENESESGSERGKGGDGCALHLHLPRRGDGALRPGLSAGGLRPPLPALRVESRREGPAPEEAVRMKGRRWVSNVPVCPLYKCTEQQCIFCDGEEFSSLRISFPAVRDRKEYMEKYCSGDYESCPVCEAFLRHM